MKKILLSILSIGIVAVAAIYGVNAFFSDTETSVGNRFVAGDIDLQIDNESYAIDWNIPGFQNPQGNFVASTHTSWELVDLTVERFFDFVDLKPGDYGEDTISVHVGSNDAWVCAAARVTADHDNTYVEPELEDDTTIGADPLLSDGELDEEVNFAFWVDDGDNVYEVGEQIFLEGPVSGLGDAGQIALADSQSSVLGGTNPIPGGDTFYIGKYWCFGEMAPAPVAQGANSPLVNTGFTCSGASVNNAAQTDVVVADLQFYAEQARNNESFQCGQWTPEWPNAEPEGEVVGALVGGYDDPATCNFTVTGAELIQADIDAAVAGNTICVDPSYTGGDTFPINVDEEVTIAGLGAMGAANVPGGMFVSASNVTIKGLEFTNYSFIQASENAAIYIHNEVGVSGVDLTNTTIDHNIFTAPGGAIAAGAKGVITEIGSVAAQATGIEVLHNVFDGWNQAMFFNTAVDYEVAYNDILNNNVGVANDGPHNASIHNNDFESNIAEAVGVAQSATNGTGNNGVLTVNTNNFFPAGVGNNVNQWLTDGAVVDATGNWWDGEVEAARTNDTAQIDTEPAVGVAFPEN